MSIPNPSNKQYTCTVLLDPSRTPALFSAPSTQPLYHRHTTLPLTHPHHQGLLLEYIQRHASPLAVVACVLIALRSEMRMCAREHPAGSALELKQTLRRFTQLQVRSRAS